LCDDFLAGSTKGNVISDRKKGWLKIFQDGWGVNGLWEPSFVERVAGDKSLVLIKDDDLTPYLRLKPLPKIIIELLSAAIGILPNKSLYWQSVIGGQALQLCLAHEVVEYRYLAFDRRTN
jgi:hypothetical protein